MTNEEIVGKWNHLKENMQHAWEKIAENDFELPKKKFSEGLDKIRDHKVSPDEIHLENYHYESHRIDDLSLIPSVEKESGIKYSYTENSEFARGAQKTEAHGIDSFGEDDSVEEDDQDFRNRKQNSDLSERFYTKGMH